MKQTFGTSKTCLGVQVRQIRLTYHALLFNLDDAGRYSLTFALSQTKVGPRKNISNLKKRNLLRYLQLVNTSTGLGSVNFGSANCNHVFKLRKGIILLLRFSLFLF